MPSIVSVNQSRVKPSIIRPQELQIIRRLLVLLILIVCGLCAIRPAGARSGILLAAWTDANGLWNWREGDAKPRQLIADVAADSSVRLLIGFSPDLEHIGYYETSPQNVLAAIRISDGSIERFALPGGRSVLSATWLAATTILFNTRTYTDQGAPQITENNDLWRADLATGGLKQLCADGQGGDFTLSPKGDQIALVTPGRYADQLPGTISVVDHDCQNRKMLLQFPVISTASESFYYPPVRWEADGTALHVAIPDPKLVYTGEEKRLTSLWRLPLADKAVVVGTLSADYFGQPKWSDDGRWITFMQRVGSLADNKIALMIADEQGQHITQVAGDKVGLLSAGDWLPASSRLIFRRNDLGQVWLFTVGETAARLLSDTSIWSPVWTVDGQTAIYATGPGASAELNYATLPDMQPHKIGDAHEIKSIIAARPS